MSELAEVPEWVVPGAAVAILRSDWRQHRSAPQLTAITKVGKRDIVLENGERFPRRTLRRSQGGVWGVTYVLMDAAAHEVREAAHVARQAHIRAKALQAAENFRIGKASALDVVLAFAPLTDSAAEIQSLCHGNLVVTQP